LKSRHQKLLCEDPKLDQTLPAFVDRSYIFSDLVVDDVLCVEPLEEESERSGSDIFQFIDLRLALDERAVESCIDNRRVTTGEQLWTMNVLGLFAGPTWKVTVLEASVRIVSIGDSKIYCVFSYLKISQPFSMAGLRVLLVRSVVDAVLTSGIGLHLFQKIS
jgi:hypothetical protein